MQWMCSRLQGRKQGASLDEGAGTAQTRVQQRRGFVWRKLPRRQVPRPQPLEELELGKEGRESETGFSAATVPAASRMTTAAVAGIAGKAQILQESSVIHPLQGQDKVWGTEQTAAKVLASALPA